MLFPVPVGDSLPWCRFLGWPHSEGKVPVFDEERYEVARYVMLKVKLQGLGVGEGRGGVGGEGEGV